MLSLDCVIYAFQGKRDLLFPFHRECITVFKLFFKSWLSRSILNLQTGDEGNCVNDQGNNIRSSKTLSQVLRQRKPWSTEVDPEGIINLCGREEQSLFIESIFESPFSSREK